MNTIAKHTYLTKVAAYIVVKIFFLFEISTLILIKAEETSWTWNLDHSRENAGKIWYNAVICDSWYL